WIARATPGDAGEPLSGPKGPTGSKGSATGRQPSDRGKVEDTSGAPAVEAVHGLGRSLLHQAGDGVSREADHLAQARDLLGQEVREHELPKLHEAWGVRRRTPHIPPFATRE